MTDRLPEAPQAPEDIIGSAAPPRRLPRRVVVGVSAVLALAVATGGGIWAVGKVGAADRTAATRAWPAPDEESAEEEKPLPPGGVGAKLLPVPDGYQPGPDIGPLGNDNVLDATRTTRHAKDAVRGLKAGERDRFAKALKKLTFTGGAQRSYSAADSLFVVELHLAQVEEAGADRALSRFRSDTGNILGALPKGPPVKANGDADCYPLPDAEGRKLDAMLCGAYVHDVLITAYAYGAEKLDTEEVARVLANQLNHVVSPEASA
ncbi:hypothetical protein OG292_22060 [Streptomyces sp. NBC_01511]|uniref:hypothetical protein n=1 Tax=unclassified Streptomyces TaxID=2593676 RepID=UPI00386C0B4C